MASSKFDLSITAQRGKAFVPYLRKHLLAAHMLIENPPTSLSVAIVGDRAMTQLHERFLNIPTPTDVLTFELDHDSDGRILAGEVVICLDEAKRQSPESIGMQRELLLYALHGMLHLSGFDDRKPREYAAMHRAEDRILTQLGVGAVFRSKTSVPRSRRKTASAPAAGLSGAD